MSVTFEGTTPDWLYRRAEDAPDAIALEGPMERVTYRELFEFAARLAGKLRAVGVAPKEPVGLLCSGGLAFARGLHGIMQCRAVTVPLNFRLTPAELAWQVNHAGVRVLLHDTAFADRARQVEEACGRPLQFVSVDDPVGSFAPVSQTHLRLIDPFAVIYTSGTTGYPKGAVISYGNQWASAVNSALQLGLSRAERWLVPMPLFHVGGLSVLIRSVIYGTTAVIHDRFDPAAVAHALDEADITIVSLVPVMLQRVLEGRTRGFPATLRCVLLGGSAAPKALLQRCQDLGIPVAQTYGLTEANSQVTTLRPEDGLRKLGSSGKPLPLTEVRVITEAGEPAEPFQPGEILVRGPTVISKYLNNDAASSHSFQDGWFRTGDIGYLDDEGYLFVLDRRTDLIVSGGENVYPREIENVLSTHPLVVDVGVAGREDATWGQVPVAFVQVREPDRPGVEEDLRQYCRERLAGYKVPKEFIFVDALPRNASGKLLRRNLREWLNTRQPHQ
jgi:O-succinylbenzoic acid--CoA ligase